MAKFKQLSDLPNYSEPPTPVFTVSGGPFGLDWTFTFGKYRHRHSLLWAIEEDPDYVKYCLAIVPGFAISEAAQELLFDSGDE